MTLSRLELPPGSTARTFQLWEAICALEAFISEAAALEASTAPAESPEEQRTLGKVLHTVECLVQMHSAVGFESEWVLSRLLFGDLGIRLVPSGEVGLSERKPFAYQVMPWSRLSFEDHWDVERVTGPKDVVVNFQDASAGKCLDPMEAFLRSLNGSLVKRYRIHFRCKRDVGICLLDRRCPNWEALLQAAIESTREEGAKAKEALLEEEQRKAEACVYGDYLLDGTTLAGVRRMLESESVGDGPMEAMLRQSCDGQEFRSERWSDRDGGKQRIVHFAMPRPAIAPPVPLSWSSSSASEGAEDLCRGCSLALTLSVHAGEVVLDCETATTVPFGDRFVVRDHITFREEGGRVFMKKVTGVVWLNPLPWLLSSLKSFIELKVESASAESGKFLADAVSLAT